MNVPYRQSHLSPALVKLSVANVALKLAKSCFTFWFCKELILAIAFRYRSVSGLKPASI